jgi:hypothetical protein
MPAKRLIAGLLLVLAAAITVAAPWAAQDRKRPRIVSAVLQDADRDARADSIRLTYSVRIRHAADRDGRYPFAVVGYRIRSVGGASRKALVLLLVEKTRPDPAARPVIRYRRTRSKPVTDRAGMQAAVQAFRVARGHGRAPKPTTTTTAPTTTTTPTPTTTTSADADRDGYADTRDCAPKDATVHPGAPDLPDLAFVDSNCDGIDGTETDAIFVSPLGNDGSPGTKEKPKRQVHAAVVAARAAGKDVYAAAGTYGRVEVASDVGIYGGYRPDSWKRGLSVTTLIVGAPEGIYASGASRVVLQALSVDGIPGAGQGASAYGIRLLGHSSVKLQRVRAFGGDGRDGLAGSNGLSGGAGGAGGNGGIGSCDTATSNGLPGNAGTSPAGRKGGRGGFGGTGISDPAGNGEPGQTGEIGTPGGAGGTRGDPGKRGSDGASGASGVSGQNGAGGTNSIAGAATVWVGQRGASGTVGAPGNGGGGGGGGGAQVGLFVINGAGNGGGGGGGGGIGGTGGVGGGFGGGSFGLYLHDSNGAISDSSSIGSARGGAGGQGGPGGAGGAGGDHGLGAVHCSHEIGNGGDGGTGGAGGAGGAGGGGAGGPSVGIFKAGTSTATVKDSAVANGAGGHGGGGPGNPGATGIAQAIFDAGP